MLAALAAASFGFLGFSVALRPLPDERRALERALIILAAEVLAAASASAGFLGPGSEPRHRAVRGALIAHATAGSLAALHALLSRRVAIDLPMSLEEVDTAPAFRKHFEDEMGRPSLERLERFLEVRSVRASIRTQLHRSNAGLAWLGATLLLLSAVNFGLELRRTLGSDPPLLSEAEVHALNDPKPVEAYFGDLPTQPRGASRVVLLVVSGLRRDALSAIPQWRDLLSSPEFARDSASVALRAGPPSTSVSQWIALATGASATLTGVYGDRRIAEPPFDSIFRQARLHGLSSFVTGSPWFTELFHSQLLRPHRFFAEGAVPPTYGAWSGWPAPPSYDSERGDGFVAGDRADAQRMTLLHRALEATRPAGADASDTPLGGEVEDEATAAASSSDAPLQGLPIGSSHGVLAPEPLRGGAYPGLYTAAEHDPRAPAHTGFASAPLGAHAEPSHHLFELLAAQLSEADVQAHCSGAATKFDPRGSYVGALASAAKRIAALVRELDATTTLLVVSDHGTVDRGGSGGSEPLAVDVPLIAYRAGSDLGARSADLSNYASDHPPLGVRRSYGWRTADVAPTIAALLGLPTPRESEGVPIAPLLPLANQQKLGHVRRDVFVQRQRLAARLASTLGVGLSLSERELLEGEAPEDAGDLAEDTARVLSLHADILARARATDAAMAAWCTLGIGLLFLGVWMAIVTRASFADLRMALQPVPGQYANRRALAFAFFGVVGFYGTAALLLYGVLRLRGFTAFDSSVLHFPTETLVFLLDVGAPATLAAYVLTRTYHFPFMVTDFDEAQPPPTPRDAPGGSPSRQGKDDDEYYSEYSYSDDDDRDTRRSDMGDRSARRGGRGASSRGHKQWAPLSSLASRGVAVGVEYLRCLFLGHAAVYSDLSMIYLIKVYVLGIAMLATLVLSYVQAGVYTFALPQLLLVRFDAESDWTSRFQLLTCQLITLCLLAAAVLSMQLWPSPDLSSAHYDKLYSLVLLKYERRRGANAKSDDVIAMLEEETEALVHARYRPVAGRLLPDDD